MNVKTAMRQLSSFDHFLCGVDTALRTFLIPAHRASRRANPAANVVLTEALTDKEKRHVAGCMRVNHAGEVSAQALYQGQALTAQLTQVKEQMITAAAEEIDHLAWCEERLKELDSHPSLINPLWYVGSFILGALAGLVSDGFSLGFVEETERQVSAHLQNHLHQVPSHDLKTKAILTQMQDDEARHATAAHDAGATELPLPVKQLMQCVSQLLTKSSYYI